MIDLQKRYHQYRQGNRSITHETILTLADFDGFAAQCDFNCDQFHLRQCTRSGILLPDTLMTASTKRQAAYFAGRYAAMLALRRMIGGKVTVGRGVDGEPLWPEAVVGSITHTNESAYCAVSGNQHYQAIGIDMEPYIDAKTAAELHPRILSKKESDYVNCIDAPFEHLLTLVFSAKESLYKALFPLCHQHFCFLDAEVTLIDYANKSFELALLRDLNKTLASGGLYNGAFECREKEVLTILLYKNK
ncbi:4'-phosphopantetheinyl transferase EntD [Sinobacterium caligoides]|uniref:Enterobactin synthase component D n=1 Tax=Sinobacterium caligoides TaxID=933926 RepID=A0A3N2DPA4_9GAMM|nr:4'-phosphopantetheinyl transferase superfamily protein [Sinobacterium caligoides]ROS01648.1 4'-phosphopantetheinyl transferase EntD [Sinobacterium caligoides]